MSASAPIGGSIRRSRSLFVALTSCVALPALVIAVPTDGTELTASSVEGGASCARTLDPDSAPSLAQAVDLALCNNEQIRASWAIIREQAAAVGQAKAAYWPSLTGTLSELRDRTSYPGSDTPTTQQTGHTIYASFDWRLFDFGGRSANKRAADAALEAAIASRDSVIQKTLAGVIAAYFGSITARATLENLTEDETVARDTWSSAQRREQSGRGAESDAQQAATALAKASLDKNRAEGALDKAVSGLVYLLGLPPGSPLQLPADVDPATGFEERDLQAWLSETEREHPAIVAARAAIDAARAQLEAARSSGRPTVDLTANYYENGFPYQGLANTSNNVATVGITVTVPLFDGFATHYKVEGAEATVREKEAEYEDIKQSTLMGVVNAFADAKSALRNLRASESLVSAAQAGFESAKRRYQSGAAEIVELLVTQTARADAKNERVRCLAEWRAARLSLLASAGRLAVADLQR